MQNVGDNLDLLQTLKSFQGVKDFEETTSFYYTFHNCPEKGEHTKVKIGRAHV